VLELVLVLHRGAVTVSSTGAAKNQIQGDDNGHVWLLPIRNSLRVTGPLPSLVLRADSEDMWCVCLLLQDLLQSCSRGGEEESGRHVL